MLIKVSKQIASTFAKIIAAKANSKPCQTIKMELSLQGVTRFRGKLRILPNI